MERIASGIVWNLGKGSKTEEIAMTKNVKIDPIPHGMHTVTPQLTCAGAAGAIDFYKKAFGAVETARLPDDEGKIMHASIRIGDSDVMLVDEDRE